MHDRVSPAPRAFPRPQGLAATLGRWVATRRLLHSAHATARSGLAVSTKILRIRFARASLSQDPARKSPPSRGRCQGCPGASAAHVAGSRCHEDRPDRSDGGAMMPLGPDAGGYGPDPRRNRRRAPRPATHEGEIRRRSSRDGSNWRGCLDPGHFLVADLWRGEELLHRRRGAFLLRPSERGVERFGLGGDAHIPRADAPLRGALGEGVGPSPAPPPAMAACQ